MRHSSLHRVTWEGIRMGQEAEEGGEGQGPEPLLEFSLERMVEAM